MTVMPCGNCGAYIEDNVFGTQCKECGWKVGDVFLITGTVMEVKDPATIALEALGHVKAPNTRCTARYKDVPATAPGPRNPPVWYDLQAGHEGPHKHCTGHHMTVMRRESLIEMKPLPELCKKCGTKWPCKDAEAVINAFANQGPHLNCGDDF